MHSKLTQVLDLMDINSFQLLDEKKTVTGEVSKQQHAEAFFSYLNLAGYLSDASLEKAVDYLAIVKPFAVDARIVKESLKNAAALARQSGQFNPEIFCDHFASEQYFEVTDILDLLAYLQQTAFDRQFGEERDKLRGKSWMEDQAKEFVTLSRSLGVISPLPPPAKHYCGIGIMGAASTRAAERVSYFAKLKEEKTVSFDIVWALTGNRELSKGLDEPAVVDAVAKYAGKKVEYKEKTVGKDKRVFADGITETMMMNHLIELKCPDDAIQTVNSEKEKGHWRATTQQNAMDIAPVVLDAIKQDRIKMNPDDKAYHFMVVAEQPYAGRMARQVSRAFLAEMKKRNYFVPLVIEGCGYGVTSTSKDSLTRINSELAALGAERFTDARARLQSKENVVLRDAKIVMFTTRDDYYVSCQKQQKKMESKPGEAEHLVKLSIFVNREGNTEISIEPVSTLSRTIS